MTSWSGHLYKWDVNLNGTWISKWKFSFVVEVCSLPKEAVQVSVPHVLEHHGQRLSICADAVETHDVLVLEHREQLRLPLEVLPGRLVGVLQSLWPGGQHMFKHSGIKKIN